MLSVCQAKSPAHLNLELKDSLVRNKKLKILLAEDNIINQKVAILILPEYGCQFVVISDGIQAVERFISGSSHVIFVHIQLSGMGVVEGIGRIRELKISNKVQNHVLIVAMTANTLRVDKVLFNNAGMDDYFGKPLQSAELICKNKRVYIDIEQKNYN